MGLNLLNQPMYNGHMATAFLSLMEIGAIALVLIIVAYIVFLFNKLIRLKNNVNNAWAQIDVQLRRRYDLVPNLIEVVKGYMKHEKGTLKEVIEARTAFMRAQTPAQKAAADNMLTGALKTLFAVAEQYPQLRAIESFQTLREDLNDTENRVSFTRQFYNDAVLIYNVTAQSFPNTLFARILGFPPEMEFFKTEGETRETVRAKFE